LIALRSVSASGGVRPATGDDCPVGVDPRATWSSAIGPPDRTPRPISTVSYAPGGAAAPDCVDPRQKQQVADVARRIRRAERSATSARSSAARVTAPRRAARGREARWSTASAVGRRPRRTPRWRRGFHSVTPGPSRAPGSITSSVRATLRDLVVGWGGGMWRLGSRVELRISRASVGQLRGSRADRTMSARSPRAGQQREDTVRRATPSSQEQLDLLSVWRLSDSWQRVHQEHGRPPGLRGLPSARPHR